MRLYNLYIEKEWLHEYNNKCRNKENFLSKERHIKNPSAFPGLHLC